MSTSERRQLHDEIVDGTIDIKDVPMAKLRDFVVDFDMDYQPQPDFFFMVKDEQRRRTETVRKAVKIDRGFFG